MFNASHAGFAGANGRAEFILANPVRAKDADARDHRPLGHTPIPQLWFSNRGGHSLRVTIRLWLLRSSHGCVGFACLEAGLATACMASDSSFFMLCIRYWRSWWFGKHPGSAGETPEFDSSSSRLRLHIVNRLRSTTGVLRNESRL